MFIEFVGSRSFEATGPLIDDFLANLGQDSPENNRTKLKNWLKAKSCADAATIDCISYIFTNPPQSELRVAFISNRQPTILMMDIIMSDPLQFRTYHDMTDNKQFEK